MKEKIDLILAFLLKTKTGWGVLAGFVVFLFLLIGAIFFFSSEEEPEVVVQPVTYELGSSIVQSPWPDKRYQQKDNDKQGRLGILLVNVPLNQETMEILEKKASKEYGYTIDLESFSSKEQKDLLTSFKEKFPQFYCPLIFDDPFAQVFVPKEFSFKVPLSQDYLADRLRDVFWHLSQDPRTVLGYVVLNGATALSSASDYDCLRLDRYLQNKPILSLSSPLIKLTHPTLNLKIFYVDAFLKDPKKLDSALLNRLEKIAQDTGVSLLAVDFHPEFLEILSKWVSTFPQKNIILIPPLQLVDDQ